MSQTHYEIGRLIHFGLDVRADPVKDQEYATLLHRYENDPNFKHAVLNVALGQGLEVADATQYGLVLVPTPDSLFRLRPPDARNMTNRDDKLITAFVVMGIAAAAYPRAELLDEPDAVPHPVTVTEVEERLRQICARHDAEAAAEPDPEVMDVEREMIAAWRILDRRPPEGDPKKRVGAATRVMIQKMLEMLAEQGMFLRRTRGEETAYQPTARFHTQVRDLQAARAFQHVQDLVEHARVTHP